MIRPRNPCNQLKLVKLQQHFFKSTQVVAKPSHWWMMRTHTGDEMPMVIPQFDFNRLKDANEILCNLKARHVHDSQIKSRENVQILQQRLLNFEYLWKEMCIVSGERSAITRLAPEDPSDELKEFAKSYKLKRNQISDKLKKFNDLLEIVDHLPNRLCSFTPIDGKNVEVSFRDACEIAKEYKDNELPDMLVKYSSPFRNDFILQEYPQSYLKLLIAFILSFADMLPACPYYGPSLIRKSIAKRFECYDFNVDQRSLGSEDGDLCLAGHGSLLSFYAPLMRTNISSEELPCLFISTRRTYFPQSDSIAILSLFSSNSWITAIPLHRIPFVQEIEWFVESADKLATFESGALAGYLGDECVEISGQAQCKHHNA
ncbi:hypothetical protein ACOME3_006206 [Neoechinorhynchus agilis]